MTTPTVATLDHLLGCSELTSQQLRSILDHAEHFRAINERQIQKVPALRGTTIVNFFVEASTRTRTSFEIAAKRLSADTLNFSASTSSLSKGETLLDTARNLEAMRPRLLVMRHRSAGAAQFLAHRIDAGIVNAGDGCNEHPTQALLDIFTMERHFGRIDERQSPLVVVIAGDIAHSRVARSNAYALRTLGAEVRLVGPRTMLPHHLEDLGARVFDSLEDAMQGSDVVMMLRIQKERMGNDLFPNDREYARYFGLDERRLARATERTIVMHPGPINRGVEIAPSVADGERSVILEQVENGVAVRMAVLYLVAASRSRRGGAPVAAVTREG